MICNVACRIVPRRAADGHPFSEILHTWRDGDVDRCALSRVNYSLADSPHARAAQNQQFINRQNRRGKFNVGN